MEDSRTTVQRHDHVMPRPTIWPAVLGAGLTLLPAGIVLGWITALTGLGLTAIGIAGWVRELLIEFPNGDEGDERDDVRTR